MTACAAGGTGDLPATARDGACLDVTASRGGGAGLVLLLLLAACGTAGAQDVVRAQEMSVADAVRLALAGAQGQAVAATVEEAQGGLQQAGLGPNPRVYLQGEDWRPWASDYDFGSQTEVYGYLGQTLELDGKRRKRVVAARAALAETEVAGEVRRREIAGRVAGAYWSAVVLGQVAGLLRDELTAVDGMVRYDAERVSAGAMAGVDLVRMQLERDRLLIALRGAERDARQGRLELFRQMGRAPVDGVRLTGRVEETVPVTTESADEVLARRPDVLAARDAVATAEANVQVQRASAVPDLELFGGYKRNATTNTGYGAVQMDLPFRNRNQGEIARAEAALRGARARQAVVETQVRAEVLESEESYRAQQEIVTGMLPGMRERARDNLQRMTEAYRMGGVDLLRYLDAQRTEFEVEVSALRTEAELQQATLRLQLSYGVQP